MDLVSEHLITPVHNTPEDAIGRVLASYPTQKHLDVLTDILTQSSTIDEQVAAIIYTAWDHVCRGDLWCSKYNSLQEYQQSIDYASVVKPILQRHKRSDRAKQISSRIILQQWNVHYTMALPKAIQPLSWSKHLLGLLATLSRAKPLGEAVKLLEGSLKDRPYRGRSQPQLLVSDVQRTLDKLEVPRLRKRKLVRAPSIVDAQKSTHSSMPVQAIDIESTGPSIQSHGQSVLPDGGYDTPKCGCAPICLPLITLLSEWSSRLSDSLATRLLHWARSVSWETLCHAHLKDLFSRTIHMDPLDLNRSQMLQHLETVCEWGNLSTDRRGSISQSGILPPVTGTPPGPELLNRFTAVSALWSSWEVNGFIHFPAFFSYMEDHGVFQRVREILTRYTSDDQSNIIVQQCYELLSQMVQQDPAYYAVIASCRPDRNWRLIHRPAHRHNDEYNPESSGIESLSIQADLETTGRGTSDVQSTIMLPSLAGQRNITVVSNSGTILNPLPHDFGQTSPETSSIDIAMLPGDLLLTLPHVMRPARAFGAPDLLNMSQSGVDENFETLENGRDGTWARVAIIQNYRHLGMQYLGPNERSQTTAHCQGYVGDECRLDSVSALGDALMGRRDWKDRKVIHQRNIVLGVDESMATSFVGQVRERLAREFHETLDLIELNHQPSIVTDMSTGYISDLDAAYTVSSGTDIEPDIEGLSTAFPWLPGNLDPSADPDVLEFMDRNLTAFAYPETGMIDSIDGIMGQDA